VDVYPSVSEATEADLDGILKPQAENQVEHGGALSASLSRSRIVGMMHSMPLVVARRNDSVIGFLMTTTRALNADIPIVRTMFGAYHGTADAYV